MNFARNSNNLNSNNNNNINNSNKYKSRNLNIMDNAVSNIAIVVVLSVIVTLIVLFIKFPIYLSIIVGSLVVLGIILFLVKKFYIGNNNARLGKKGIIALLIIGVFILMVIVTILVMHEQDNKELDCCPDNFSYTSDRYDNKLCFINKKDTEKDLSDMPCDDWCILDNTYRGEFNCLGGCVEGEGEEEEAHYPYHINTKAYNRRLCSNQTGASGHHGKSGIATLSCPTTMSHERKIHHNKVCYKNEADAIKKNGKCGDWCILDVAEEGLDQCIGCGDGTLASVRCYKGGKAEEEEEEEEGKHPGVPYYEKCPNVKENFSSKNDNSKICADEEGFYTSSSCNKNNYTKQDLYKQIRATDQLNCKNKHVLKKKYDIANEACKHVEKLDEEITDLKKNLKNFNKNAGMGPCNFKSNRWGQSTPTSNYRCAPVQSLSDKRKAAVEKAAAKVTAVKAAVAKEAAAKAAVAKAKAAAVAAAKAATAAKAAKATAAAKAAERSIQSGSSVRGLSLFERRLGLSQSMEKTATAATAVSQKELNAPNEDGIIGTPCLNQNSDFDYWCSYANSGNNQKGSVGVKSLTSTGCEHDGNTYKGICGLGYKNGINVYDNYTPCMSANDTNEINIACKTIMKKTFPQITNIQASNIDSYDCNPPYVRAQCLTPNEAKALNTDQQKKLGDYMGWM